MSEDFWLINLLGSVALLLWATKMVSHYVREAFGADFRRYLSRATQNRWLACVTGTGVAAALQSSTATALLLVTFLQQGLVMLAPALAIMLGADIGTTVVVQILSFDISFLAPGLLITGFLAFSAGQFAWLRNLGRIILALGLIVLSLNMIVEATEPMRESELVKTVLDSLSGQPVLALVIAALLTWLSHSSAAIVLLIMSMSGVFPGTLGLALVLGANVGSGLVMIGLTAQGDATTKRLPIGNLLFRLSGALIVLPFLEPISAGLGMLEDNPARELANFHTLFNIALALAFVPLIGPMARFLEKAVPEEKSLSEERVEPRFLDESVIDQPSMALACATREMMRMADLVETMLRQTMDAFKANEQESINTISRRDNDIDRLHEAIKLYVAKVMRNQLSEDEMKRCFDIMAMTTDLEHIGDVIDKNLLRTASKRLRNRLQFSQEGWQEIKEFHGLVVAQMQLAMTVFFSRDIEMARQLVREKDKIRDWEQDASERHMERLRHGQMESIETSALHLDILRDFKRITAHLTSFAHPILKSHGELLDSRLRAFEQKEAQAHSESGPAQQTAETEAEQKEKQRTDDDAGS
ncbi:Na/Pi cotransporter family protein [Fodinicurvata sediminis]|uniref:Na/Pi cotransporter family protein n=1 Tax=Fodinicurvata sediminis TaxID=1121832 RepID=UPI0003B6A0BF|nr:Na/Pi cotransporter family protein [Fodinicurvata sediminis]